MRKLALAAIALLALSAQAAGYSGSWSLDKAKSSNLPPYYEQITGHDLKIAQDDNELAVTAVITADRGPENFEFRYKLDGTATAGETSVRTPNGERKVPTVLQLKKADNGDLNITIERELPSRDGSTFKGTTIETWHLDAEGKVLTIDRVDETRRGRTEARMVFVRR
jgi:hypothetical protein